MAAPAPPASASQDELNAIVCGVLPRQGAWSEEEYLWLTDRSRRLIELTDGYVQELPMPTSSHQVILAFLYRLFHGWIGPRGGVVLFSALRLRVREGMFREPDLLLLRDRAAPRVCSPDSESTWPRFSTLRRPAGRLTARPFLRRAGGQPPDPDDRLGVDR